MRVIFLILSAVILLSDNALTSPVFLYQVKC